MTIDRHFDAAGQAWEYADQELQDIILLWLFDYRFNLASFDDWIEDPATVPARRAQLLQLRQRVIDAERAGNHGEAEMGVRLLAETLTRHCHVSALLGPALHGDVMEKGRKKDTVGKVRAWVRKYMGMPKHSAATAAEAWDAFSRRPPKGCKAFDNECGKYIETYGAKNIETTKYRAFANIVSKERPK